MQQAKLGNDSKESNKESNVSNDEFYDKIADDIKKVLIQFVSEAGHGKALGLDTPIPTVDGWKTMGEIQVGDVLFDERGKQCNVISTSPVMYNHDVYEFEFDDGSTIKTDKEHLWLTSTRISRLAEYRRKKNNENNGRPLYSIKTTEEIVKTLRVHKKKATNHAIPINKPLKLEKKELPIYPYVLGVWLGDGTSSNGVITVCDSEILEKIRLSGYKLKQWNTKKPIKPYNVIGLHTVLKKNNLINNKHIPKDYLRSSYDQRLELLRGLLDADGTVSKDHHVSYCTTSEKLANDVSELLHTLGIKHRFVIHEAKLYGRLIGKRYRFRFSINEKLFYIKRKQERINKIVRSTREVRYIINARKIETEPVKCIGVDSPNHLFLAGRQMVPTHNSSSLRTIIHYCKKKHPDIQFIIFDTSMAWFHNAPVKYRQLVTVDKLKQGKISNEYDTVYEMGSLSENDRRAFVGQIIAQHYRQRYQAKLQDEKLKDFPFLVFVMEEANVYFGPYSLRRNDEYTQVFQDFVSVGRNYKIRGFLIATAEVGEISPSLRRRSRRIYGRVESEGDLARIRKKDKKLAEYIGSEIPRFHFVYYADRAYGPVKVPDLVNNVPIDFVRETKEEEKEVSKSNWLRNFLIGLSIPFIVLMFILYFLGY